MYNKKYMDIMKAVKEQQMILQGPPGTSKTYGALEFIISEIVKAEGSELKDATPISEDGKKLLNDHQLKNEDYEEGPKPNDSRKIFWDIVQFHPSYGYEDFVRGISIVLDKDTNNISDVKYRQENKILGKIARFTEKLNEENKSDKKVFLVIDEINRANVAVVLGELIYALEKRGEKIKTPYDAGDGFDIELPDNLYIIGTMNTADKSIGNIDYAIRRRFLFFPVLPNVNIIKEYCDKTFKGQQGGESKKQLRVKLFEYVKRVFDEFLNDEDYFKDDVQVGHTMFLAESDDELKYKFEYQVLPILREYYKDGVLIKKGNYEQNKIMKYLIDFGKNNSITEEELYGELVKENLNTGESNGDI